MTNLLEATFKTPWGIRKSKRMHQIELSYGKPLEVLLPELLERHKDKKAHAQKMAVAKELGISKQYIYNLIALFMDGNNEGK